MLQISWTTFGFLLIFYTSCNSALYFHIRETEKKCFIEEIPDQTMVVGQYKIQEHDEDSNQYYDQPVGRGHALGMFVEIRDPMDQIVLNRMYAAEGKFTFTSHSAGEHQICLHSNSSAWFGGGQLRVHLDIQVGDHAVDYGDVASKEKLTELQLRIRQLLDQVDQIQKEQNYQRYREERFRATSESTNQRVLYWSLAQTAVLLITGAWQMRHLKGFFEAKKLV